MIRQDGSFAILHLPMPGRISAYNGMREDAISPDGKLVAYSICLRDRNDTKDDISGKLYNDLFYQQTDGSAPKKIAINNCDFVPDWNPAGTKIAFRTKTDTIIIADLEGQKIVSISPPVKQLWVNGAVMYQEIDQIRWSPDGRKLAFIFRKRLYLVNADGTGLEAVKFNPTNVDVASFAWSPMGDKFLFRSSFGAEEQCSFNIIYHFEVGKFPCIQSYHLYTSNSDGSNLKRITRKPDYTIGKLFWVY